MKALVNMLIMVMAVVIIAGCKGTVHIPVYKAAYKLEKFNWDTALDALEIFANQENFKLRATGNNLPLAQGRKLFIYSYQRHDRLSFTLSNAQDENCLMLTVFDRRKRDIDYQPLVEKLVSHLMGQLSVTNFYPSKTACLDSDESYGPAYEIPTLEESMNADPEFKAEVDEKIEYEKELYRQVCEEQPELCTEDHANIEGEN